MNRPAQGAAGHVYRFPGPCLPAAISYDPGDEEMEGVHQRMTTEPGNQLARGQEWRGTVRAWWCGPWGLGGQAAGWKRVVPCLALLSEDGELVRLFGWDTISQWSKIVQGTFPGQLADGVDVHVRSAESPDGAHWWWVLDRVGADGALPTEAREEGPDEQA